MTALSRARLVCYKESVHPSNPSFPVTPSARSIPMNTNIKVNIIGATETIIRATETNAGVEDIGVGEVVGGF